MQFVENDQVKQVWIKYVEKLLNDENTWDNATTFEKVEWPCELIRDEILKALRMMKKGKAASGIVSELFMSEEVCSVDWLTCV